MSRIPTLDEKDVLLKSPTEDVIPAKGIDVTVVTVVFEAVRSGRENAFCACLDSVQRQCGCAVEHIVVDGASEDGTLDLVRGYRNAHVPLRLFSAPDSGIYEAMNRGIALARGEFVVFLNSDDFFNDPQGLAESVRTLGSSGADFSYAPAIVVNERDESVPHAFCEGRPFALSEGMTLCHQTMLTRRDVLVRLDGFDTSCRSAADYGLLLGMVHAGCRACRVARSFVTFRLGGYSAVNADVCDREMAEIYVRFFNSRFGTHLSAEDGRRIRRTGLMPEALSCALLASARKTYGDCYGLSEAQREGWRNLLAGRLQERACAWSRKLRCPNALKRLILAVRRRRTPDVDRQAKADDLDFMYRYVQRVQATESGIATGDCIESKFGLATSGCLDLSFGLNDWLRNRAVRLGLLVRVDATGCPDACRARVTCRGHLLARIKASPDMDMPLVDIAVPAVCNVGDEMRLRIELVDGRDNPLGAASRAALVYGGLAVWRKVV